MNEKLERHIKDTIAQLELNEAEGNYLKSCMQMAFTMGERNQLEIDHKAEMERLDGMFKK